MASAGAKLILIKYCSHGSHCTCYVRCVLAKARNDLTDINPVCVRPSTLDPVENPRSAVEMTKTVLIIPILLALHALAGCEIAPALHVDEQVKAAFSDVVDVYAERLELVDEATALARRYRPADSSTLADVADARAAIVALHPTPALVDEPALFERFDVAQRQLTEAISQLMVVCESVPRINASPRFRTLQARLARSAGQIAIARDRYDKAAQRYNASLHRFPFNLAQAIHADENLPTFSAPDSSPVHRRPRTDFGTLRGSLRV